MTLDFTLFIQLGIFLYVLFILHSMVIRPIMRLLERRDALTVGKSVEADDFGKKVEEIQLKIDSEVGALKISLDEQRQETLKRNRDLADTKVAETRARVDRQVEEQRGGLAKDAEKVRSKIPGLAQSVSDEIVKTLLSSKVVRL